MTQRATKQRLPHLLLLVASMRQHVLRRLGGARAESGSAGEAPRGPPAPASSPRRAEPGRSRRSERSRSCGSSTAPGAWGQRFARELLDIAAVEGGSVAPVVVESHRVPNVGANADIVVVNPAWMERVSREICGGGAQCRRDLVRGIAGHEWSHVAAARDPSRRRTSPRQRELEADRHAGRVLSRTGASSEPLRALLSAGPSDASPSHPGSAERLEAIFAGEDGQGDACRGEGDCTCDEHG